MKHVVIFPQRKEKLDAGCSGSYIMYVHVPYAVGRCSDYPAIYYI